MKQTILLKISNKCVKLEMEAASGPFLFASFRFPREALSTHGYGSPSSFFCVEQVSVAL